MDGSVPSKWGIGPASPPQMLTDPNRECKEGPASNCQVRGGPSRNEVHCRGARWTIKEPGEPSRSEMSCQGARWAVREWGGPLRNEKGHQRAKKAVRSFQQAPQSRPTISTLVPMKNNFFTTSLLQLCNNIWKSYIQLPLYTLALQLHGGNATRC